MTNPSALADRSGWYTAADVPERAFHGTVRGLGVSGQGEPGGARYAERVQALYAVAGTLAGMAGGFPLPPLEGRWWVQDTRPPLTVPREEWYWHLFLKLPAEVDDALADRAREAERGAAMGVEHVQVVSFTEGDCVQMTHHGPYADEARSLALMESFMAEHALVPFGLHHEIYISDVRETDPAAMHTILRQPVRPAS
ncbi:transcriptional regulator [Sphaerisporangium krabiense]|uniref:GyrI-like small molecule binding domain-containing protein n=1 Tax=Sphaerisporangium krabiense TaxID=763782 RepID=A0A7W9DU23_9ACTN|nr:GyrI-like domain-containing protein [Sphaerisporangium krabiense]MBB5631223.1 hypothetical protein [Sphaerisporangium krabiense]GII61164.1 transcriptional regulator [Sphaerisporangium krabiense]